MNISLNTHQKITFEQLVVLDQQDPFATKRAEFSLPESLLYLDGNSLGAMPKAAAVRAQQVMLQQWSADLITSWNRHQWIDLPSIVAEKIAPLIGAAPGQVICCDSTSVNLFKVLSCAMLMQQTAGENKRPIVLSQAGNFPTDLYMVEGLASLIGIAHCQLRLVETSDDNAEQRLEQALTDDVAVLLLTQVDFRSGRLLDMQRLTRAAHAKGVLVIWDLAHSAGALPVELDACDVDFAIGCGYKYLNGGPGAPAFIYAAKRHHANISQPLSGWMGHTTPFSFTPHYAKAAGIKQFLTGTPAILSMSVLDAALEVFRDVDMQQLRAKSLALSDIFQTLVLQHPSLNSLTLVTPLQNRGSQLAYQHPEAYAICQALIAQGVVADFRAPNILRLGFTPLYLRYVDMYQAVAILADVVASKAYERPEYRLQHKVT
ncbi:kynureninase [Arsukibacterium sp.]|uniref:kynureninase n=1 Tax=Arsukibacterium sp. TaxID=1977258 RepID=UPI002FDB159E